MWLEDSLTIKSNRGDSVTICVGDSIVKVDTPGKVLCKYCYGVINYCSKGRVAIIDHLKSGKHASEIDHRQSNYTFESQFSQKNVASALFSLFKPPPPPPKKLNPAKDLDPPRPPAPKLIPLVDHTANMESMILSFRAENNLSFTLAPKLVELFIECAADPKVLSSVSLTPCSAAYKLTYGVSLTPCSAAISLHMVFLSPHAQLPINLHTVFLSPHAQLPINLHTVFFSPHAQLPINLHTVFLSPHAQLPINLHTVFLSPHAQLPINLHTVFLTF